jgi:hypothetical protein
MKSRTNCSRNHKEENLSKKQNKKYKNQHKKTNNKLSTMQKTTKNNKTKKHKGGAGGVNLMKLKSLTGQSSSNDIQKAAKAHMTKFKTTVRTNVGEAKKSLDEYNQTVRQKATRVFREHKNTLDAKGKKNILTRLKTHAPTKQNHLVQKTQEQRLKEITDRIKAKKSANIGKLRAKLKERREAIQTEIGFIGTQKPVDPNYMKKFVAGNKKIGDHPQMSRIDTRINELNLNPNNALNKAKIKALKAERTRLEGSLSAEVAKEKKLVEDAAKKQLAAKHSETVKAARAKHEEEYKSVITKAKEKHESDYTVLVAQQEKKHQAALKAFKSSSQGKDLDKLAKIDADFIKKRQHMYSRQTANQLGIPSSKQASADEIERIELLSLYPGDLDTGKASEVYKNLKKYKKLKEKAPASKFLPPVKTEFIPPLKQEFKEPLMG